jgi:hypothetical protein
VIFERNKVAEAVARQLVRDPDLEKAVAAVALLLDLPEPVVFECVMNEVAATP